MITCQRCLKKNDRNAVACVRCGLQFDRASLYDRHSSVDASRSLPKAEDVLEAGDLGARHLKSCPRCRAHVAINADFCPSCRYAWTAREALDSKGAERLRVEWPGEGTALLRRTGDEGMPRDPSRKHLEELLDEGRAMTDRKYGSPQLVGVVVDRPERITLPESNRYLLQTAFASRKSDVQDAWKGLQFRVRIDQENKFDRVARMETVKYNGAIYRFDPIVLWGTWRGGELVIAYGYNLRLQVDITLYHTNFGLFFLPRIRIRF